jgi:two-component system KDP operon response regulator KdpE
VAARDPPEAMKLAQEEEPELILLDVRLPGATGFDLFQRLRKVSDSSVIFLSVSSREDDIVRGLQLGGDDYISKPFSPPELLARVELALRRRPESHTNDKAVSIDGLTVNFAERRVVLDGEEVQLSATEYKLLSELAAHAGLVLTHSQILQRVWGPNYEGEVALVRTFIRNLRQKLNDDAVHSRYIITHPGIGYRMARPA